MRVTVPADKSLRTLAGDLIDSDAVPAGSVPSRAGLTAVGRGLRLAAYVLAAGAVVRLLTSVDFAAVRASLSVARPWAPLALLPFGLQVLLECASWRLLFAKLSHSVGWRIALRVQLGAEAVRLGLPGGSALAEGLRPALFTRHARIPASDGAAALTVRKLCHLGTQGLYVALGAALGTALFVRWTPLLGHIAPALPALSFAVAACLVGAAVLLGLVLFHGSLASRAEQALTRLTRGKLASFLEGHRASYAAVDGRLRTLLQVPSSVLFWNVATAVGGWLLDAAETWLILWLLGMHLGWGETVALEALVSLVRPAAFLVPGGLGIQDLGYHALLSGALGDAGALSFVLAKRARDLVWLVTGLCFRPL